MLKGHGFLIVFTVPALGAMEPLRGNRAQNKWNQLSAGYNRACPLGLFLSAMLDPYGGGGRKGEAKEVQTGFRSCACESMRIRSHFSQGRSSGNCRMKNTCMRTLHYEKKEKAAESRD